MAFLRAEKKKSGTYINIVESYRDANGASRQKYLYNLGKAEDYSKKTLKSIGYKFLELAGEKRPDSIPFTELSRHNYGFVQAYDKIMKDYGLDALFKKISTAKKLNYDLYRHILLMLVERLNDPSSKLAGFIHKEEYLGLEDIDLHNLYRSLDHLYAYQDKVQEMIYRQGRNLFNSSLDVVFYDVTTFYFDSEIEDGFRMHGFSKDGKIGKTVIVFGLLIDSDKNPVAYKIYRGGFYEGHTFIDALRQLKHEYKIGKVITVADRGMMNRENIKAVENEAGYEYIIGERLKNLAQKLQKRILDRKSYRVLEIEHPDGGENIKIEYLVVESEGKRIISTYSDKRAAKDLRDREKRIDRGMQMLKNPAAGEKKARRNYLKREGSGKYDLDKEKIAADALYDGFLCLATNNREMSVEELLSQYKQLYKIEHSFRTFKSYLETRPMFHWTQKRIEGRLCLCYIAFTLMNYLRNRLRDSGIKMSERQIRETLDKMQMSLVEHNEDKFYMRSKNTNEMHSIIKTLKLKAPPDFFPKIAVNDYISTA